MERDRKGRPKKREEAYEQDPELKADADRVASMLAHALRKLMGRSQEKCRLWVVAPTVTFVEYRSGEGKTRLACEGLSTCKSANCPLCVRKWERTRTAEIQAAVSNWLRKELPTVFASLTMRHHSRMPLALTMRILCKAFGELFSGTKGQKFAAAIGGKPEYVRAQDLTWSVEQWWHPHLHALFFHGSDLGMSIDELQDLMTDRWLEALPAALRAMQNLVGRMLGGGKHLVASGCRPHQRFMARIARRGGRCWKGHALHRRLKGRKNSEEPAHWDPIEEHHQCSDCALELGLRGVKLHKKKATKTRGAGYVIVGTIPEPGDRVLHQEVLMETCSACMFGTAECPNQRERACRMFGKELVPDAIPLKDSLIRIRKMLRTLTEKNILPTRDRAVVLDQIKKGDPADRVAGYLPKLGAIGFELASSSTKLGWEDEHGRRHFSKWEVAHLCALKGENKLRGMAASAWRQMYKATRGTSLILFSDRAKLGIGPDPYENGNEPPEIDIDEDETRRVLGEADKPVWVGMARAHGHALIGAIASAHRAGTLESLSWVLPPKGDSGEPQATIAEEDRAPADLSAEARARWRSHRRRWEYDADKLDRSSRWAKLREVAAVAGPEAWTEMIASILGEGRWLGAGAVRGADHWHDAHAAHERREGLRRGEGERFDMVTRALEQLGEANALKSSGAPLNVLKLRLELARTLQRTGLDRTTAERMAREMVN